MKSKTLLVMSLVALLSLGLTHTSFARNGGMGGGFGSSRGTASGPSGSDFGNRGSFQSSGQAINGSREGYVAPVRNRNMENIQDRHGIPSDAGGFAIGNQQGYNIRSQNDNIGNRYGQQNGVSHHHGDGFGAVPAIPADPGALGEAATSATPAIPAGN